MAPHNRQANARQPNCDTKPDTHNENRITKAKRNGTSSALSDLAKTIAKAENSSSASTTSVPASGAENTSGRKVHSRNFKSKAPATKPKHTTVNPAPSKPCSRVVSIDTGKTRMNLDPVPPVSRPRKAPSSASDKSATEIPTTKDNLNKAANSAATASVPQRTQYSASSSNTLSSKQPNPRILAYKPSAPAVTKRTGSSVSVGLKRCASSTNQESGRAVRPKVARETSHIVRTDSTNDRGTSAASQDTLVEPQSSSPIKSDPALESLVVDQGVSVDIVKRKIAQPGRAFSLRYLHNVQSPFKKDFDADKEPAVEDNTAPECDDIDAEEANDPSMVTDYMDDIFKYLHETEGKFIPDHQYMDKQDRLDWSVRYDLIKWTAVVHHLLDGLPEVLFHAVNLIDRYLSERKVPTTDHRLIALAALLIAYKYEQGKGISLKRLVEFSDNAYTVNQIRDAEWHMLRILDFDLSYPGPYIFLQRIHNAGLDDIQTRTVAEYLTEVCIMDHRLLRYPPSLLAAAGVCLARRMLDACPWDGNLSHCSGYTEAELQPCIDIVLDHIRKSREDSFINIKYQYARNHTCSTFCRDWAMVNAH